MSFASILPNSPPALLALADGSIWSGYSIGAAVAGVGEVVFNTAITGYQEILSDPSYCRQLITLTYPHIGNQGCNPDDDESAHPWAAGLIVKDVPATASNYRMRESLPAYLQRQGLAGMAGLDTRRLTRHIRTHGAQAGCILPYALWESVPPTERDVSAWNPQRLLQADFALLRQQAEQQALSLARAFAGLAGADLAREVSTKQAYNWAHGVFDLDAQSDTPVPAPRWHVVAYDFGVKHNILRLLAQRGCRITVVPAQTSSADVLALAPDGVFLSNGPGDPEPCDYAIQAVRDFIARGVPVFGICLGHQILGLACGGRTYKMKFGHHGANHPVREIASGRVCITSQNHGFAVDAERLPADLEVTHVSLFDGSLQGIRHRSKPAFGFQGHPEASPGPQDILHLFDQFVSLMQQHAPQTVAKVVATPTLADQAA